MRSRLKSNDVSQIDQASAEIVETWVLGYLSGAAAATGSDILKGTTAESVWSEFDRRCTLKPNEMIANIALSVKHDLEK